MIAGLIALAGAFATATPGQSNRECVFALARALEPSGEEARLVAEAAVIGCVSTEPTAPPSSLFAAMPPEKQTELITLSRAITRENALLYIVRIRACRKTVGCDLRALAQ